MTRRRKLHPEEMELWQQIARSADPLHKHRKLVQEKPAPKKSPLPRARPEPAPITRFALGDMAPPQPETHAQPRTTAAWLRAEPVNMDARSFAKMKRGKLVPEARIDLHGMTLDQAHPELLRFIMGAHTRGLRLVLVITGKGGREDPYDPMPMRRGVLKRQVPLWLTQPPAAQAVLQVTEAHLKHGGSGAYYVYLKRRR